MDVTKVRKFFESHRLLASTVALLVLLLGSMFQNLQLFRRAEQERQRAITAERSSPQQERQLALEDEKAASFRTAADEKQAKLVAKRQAERAKDAARVRELYQELNRLTEINEQILLQTKKPSNLPAPKTQPVKLTNPPEIGAVPASRGTTVR